MSIGRQVGLHVVHEEGVVGPGGDDADLDAVLGVPVEELVVHEHLVQGVEVVHGPLPVGQERVLVHLDVGRPPACTRGDHQDQGVPAANQRLATAEQNERAHSLAPPQLLRGGLVLDDALVPGRPPGLGARQRRQRAVGRDERPLLVLDRLLVQLCFFFLFDDKHHKGQIKHPSAEKLCTHACDANCDAYQQARGCRGHE